VPRVLLTDIIVRNATARAGERFTIWDTKLPTFGLRVGATTRTWTVMVDRRSRRRITVGRYPAMTLQIARAEARRLINASAVTRSMPGITPITFSAALEKFIELHVSQTRASTAKEYERALRKHCEPFWKSRLVSEIHRADVITVLDRLGRRPIANGIFGTIRLFFRWSVRRGYLLHTPCEAMRAPTKVRSRERVLNHAELRTILTEARLAGTFGTIVTLLAFTGQRRGEIAALHSSWVDRAAETFTIPSHVAKNGREHQVPLTPTVLALLPSHEGLLFPARGLPETPFNGWSKGMHAFRKACAIQDFRLHDLRRTAATVMAEDLDILPHIIERLLNHVSGTISPVGKIYNRARYLPEIRQALLAYEGFLLRLLGQDGDKSSAPLPSPATLHTCQPETDIVRQSPTVSDTDRHSRT
jgi:integrase